jgi:hypothetical protein
VDESCTMSRKASESVARLDFPKYAEELLMDFSSLAGESRPKDSRS